MICAELDQRAVDYLYGELAPAERAAVEAHAAGCDNCRRELRALERTLGVTREALRGPLAHEAPSRVRVALEAEAARVAAQAAARQVRAGGGLWAWLRRPWFLPAVASFAVVALFFIARPAIVDKPKLAVQEIQEEAVRAQAPAPEPPRAPEPVLAQPPAPAQGESYGSGVEGGVESLNERARAKKADRGGQGAVTRPAPARRAAPGRWATPPPAASAPQDKEAKQEARADEAARAPIPRPEASSGAGSIGSLKGRSANMATGGAGKGAAMPRTAAQPTVAKGRSAGDDPLGGQDLGGPAPAPPPAAAPAAAAPAKPAAEPAPELARRQPSSKDDADAVETSAAKASRPEEEESKADRALPLEQLRKRADLAFQQSRWDRAISDYRELLRRFAGHADAPLWKRRLDVSLQSAGR